MPHPRQDTGREGRTGVLSRGSGACCQAGSARRSTPPPPRAQVHKPVEDVRLVPGQKGPGGLPLDEVGQQVLLRVRRPREAVDEVLHVLGSGGSGWSTTRRSAASMREAASGT